MEIQSQPRHTPIITITRSPSSEDDENAKVVLRSLDPGRSRYLVSWGVGTRVALISWLAVVLIPICVVIITADQMDISEPINTVISVMFTVALIHVILLVCISPSSLTRNNDEWTIRVSPFGVPVYRFRATDVISAARVYWRDILRWKFTGFVTDWKKCVGISLTSGKRIVVSLRDPDMFIKDISSSSTIKC
jgi:hypothetical protein